MEEFNRGAVDVTTMDGMCSKRRGESGDSGVKFVSDSGLRGASIIVYVLSFVFGCELIRWFKNMQTDVVV